ncbi:MAG TPA: hypothetical protein VJ063_16970 [Verrucomicrobiae bacterium]|nr:hypothetical protein [Verrucomicrobiae bacterium]
MELGKAGDILKNHYEKLVLGLALLGLAAAVVILLQASSDEQDKIKDYVKQIAGRTPAPVKPLDLGRLESTLKKAQSPPALTLAGEHNLFNPVKWQRRGDGAWVKNVKGTEGTVDELEITRIAPLQYIISLDKFTGTGYTIVVTNEAAVPPYPKRYSQFYTPGDTNKPVLILRQVMGAPDNPDGLVVEIKDTGERIEIGKDRPFVRTNTFEVDLKWKVENREFKKQRTNSVLNLGGDPYKIVAINPAEVVLSAPNDKKYTVPAPRAP